MAPKSQRGINWKPEEDEGLCKGWVCISEEEVIGMNQPNNTFLGKGVPEVVLENMKANDRSEARTPQAIASRFKIINQQCSLWKACLIKANASPSSGSNPRDLVSTNFIRLLMFIL